MLIQLALAAAAYAALPAPARAEDKKPTAKTAKDKAAKAGEDERELLIAPDEPSNPKVYSDADRKRLCAKYSNQLIAYYGDVWKVENCKRRLITESKTVYSLQRSGQKVLDVPADVIAALLEGDALDLNDSVASARNCKQLDGHYVTFSAVDVYIVEQCKRRLFPDWATYVKHRDKRGDKKGEILSLSLIEFDKLMPGEPIPSIVDDQFTKLLTGSAGVDVIPIDEACEHLEGHLASYYSRLYRIERCRKREIVEPDVFVVKNGGGALKIVEMKSEQWLSLPDGEPIGAPLKPVAAKIKVTAKK